MAAAIMDATLHLAMLIAAVCCVCNEWCDDAIWVCCFKSKMSPKEFNSNMYACVCIYLLSLTAHISCRHPWSQSVILGRQPLQRSLRGQDWKYLSSAVAGFKEPWGWGGGVHRFKPLCQPTVNILGLYVCQGFGFGFLLSSLVLLALSTIQHLIRCFESLMRWRALAQWLHSYWIRTLGWSKTILKKVCLFTLLILQRQVQNLAASN